MCIFFALSLTIRPTSDLPQNPPKTTLLVTFLSFFPVIFSVIFRTGPDPVLLFLGVFVSLVFFSLRNLVFFEGFLLVLQGF